MIKRQQVYVLFLQHREGDNYYGVSGVFSSPERAMAVAQRDVREPLAWEKYEMAWDCRPAWTARCYPTTGYAWHVWNLEIDDMIGWPPDGWDALP